MEYGQNYVKYLELNKIAGLRLAGKDQFEGYITISENSRSELLWWKHTLPQASKVICNKAQSTILTTDASLSGWGAVWEGTSTGGIRSNREKLDHINVLELQAVLLGLQSFFREKTKVAIRVLTDNTTTVAYVNHMGGTKSIRCNEVAKRIWHWCENRDLWLYAAHIPGTLNVQADHESRQYSENTEWAFSNSLFEQVVRKWGVPDHKVPRYASWLPDPGAEVVNDFTVQWNHYKFICVSSV